MLNKRGQRIEPWGTPCLFCTVRCVIPNRSSKVVPIIQIGPTQIFSVSTDMLWSTMSMLSFKTLTRAVSALWCPRNPDWNFKTIV